MKYFITAFLGLLFASNAFAEETHSLRIKQESPAHSENSHAASPHAHWSYKGENDPDHWGDMEGNAVCKTGHAQSPINIVTSNVAKSSYGPISINYGPIAGNIINNGHTIQTNVNSGNYINIGGKHYNLVQFHFHTPSEEAINGKRYPMVAHFVNKSEDGQLAVIAVLFKTGRENAYLRRIFNEMPKTTDNKVDLPKIDIGHILPEDKSYYSFTGSLTTPPCSEGVKWHVLKTPVELSAAQLNKFQKLYPMNARPVQPLYDRQVMLVE